jgi:LAO/AO transport system kinase
VLVETVGVGQVELEVVSVADTIVVVTVPALGDGVQTIKAGLTEIADVFVVNMADRPGANRTAVDLTHMVRESGRETPVLQTIASEGGGVDALFAALQSPRAAAAAPTPHGPCASRCCVPQRSRRASGLGPTRRRPPRATSSSVSQRTS